MTVRTIPLVATLAAAVAVTLALAGTSVRPRPETPAATATPATTVRPPQGPNDVGRVKKSEAEWKRSLGPAAYHVLRERGTERAFTGKLLNEHRAGTYSCAACGLELFSSATKFDSGTGWPSFWAPLNRSHVQSRVDTRYGAVSEEIVCARCEGHLGHVFDDGPRPTGRRYCMNSVALAFTPKKGR